MLEEVRNPFDDDSRVEDPHACVGHLAAQTLEDIVQIGRNLVEVRALLSPGQFLHWCASEFGMSRQTANRSMRFSEMFGGRSTMVAHLPLRILDELAAPSTSDTIIEQVASGQIPPTVQAIKAAKEAERQARQEREAASRSRLACRSASFAALIA